DVLRMRPEALTASALVRTLALLRHMNVSEVSSILQSDTATSGNPSYSFSPEPYFELLANVNFPRTSAFGIRFGLEAYIIVDYGREINLEPIEATERRARDVRARIMLTPRTDMITSV